MTIKSARKDTGRRSVKPDFTRRTQRSPQPGARQRGIYTTRLGQIRDVLNEVLKWKHPADAVLSAWFRANKSLGGRDRNEVAEAVFDVLRHLRRYRQYAESGTGPALERLAILGLASVVGKDTIAGQLSEEEKSWLLRMDTIDPASLAPEIRGSLPDWLYEHMSQLDEFESLIAALNTKAPLDLRVNPFKVDRDTVLAQLQDTPVAEFDPQPTPYSPWGIRLNGKPAISRWALFENGSLEVQDEGSQLLALLVGPKRTDMVIDFCAGAGGKTLLLGALMRSAGRLYAFDVSAARLAKAKPRIARSGLSNVTPIAIANENDTRVKRLAGKADKVLVDAPCTGVGTLRRNPDLKWRQSPASVQELTELQARILNSAARCVAPGGRLVYSTCSVLPQENEQQVDAFLAAHPEFTLLNAQEVLGDRCPDLGMTTPYLRLRPDVHGTDGFFAAVLERSK
ncbi:MAG TPA: rRNA methyltransferase [Advenella kashmirensis]|uniref:rRNA methyltransferase n=1 Tax=Advenella kashmirensis TaxID=310575 RepID=A0A356LA49_9BURK|nr:rRNA methyltransferase [Advenella kashmirensis]